MGAQQACCRRWQLPSNYFYVDVPVPAGAPTIRAFFVDANPFIASCVRPTPFYALLFKASAHAKLCTCRHAGTTWRGRSTTRPTSRRM